MKRINWITLMIGAALAAVGVGIMSNPAAGLPISWPQALLGLGCSAMGIGLMAASTVL